jgi:type II secretory pathway pseudopilin PulG
VLGVVIAALVGAALPGCGFGNGSDSGSDQSAKQEELAQARADARRQAQQEERLKGLERRLRDGKQPGSSQQNGSSTSGSPGSSSPTAPTPPAASSESASCGARGLSVGPHTSCAFGANVRDAYFDSAAGNGDATVRAFSLSTRRTHSMRCSGGTPHVCTGANNATVSFP